MDRLAAITDAIRNSVNLMVDRPESVTVECQQHQDGATLRIDASPAELGKIIGKQGRNARALRILANAMGMAAKLRISVDIRE